MALIGLWSEVGRAGFLHRPRMNYQLRVVVLASVPGGGTPWRGAIRSTSGSTLGENWDRCRLLGGATIFGMKACQEPSVRVGRSPLGAANQEGSRIRPAGVCRTPVVGPPRGGNGGRKCRPERTHGKGVARLRRSSPAVSEGMAGGPAADVRGTGTRQGRSRAPERASRPRSGEWGSSFARLVRADPDRQREGCRPTRQDNQRC